MAIGTTVSAVIDILGECTDFIGNNAVLMTVFAGSLVAMGFKLFKKAKRAVK